MVILNYNKYVLCIKKMSYHVIKVKYIYLCVIKIKVIKN